MAYLIFARVLVISTLYLELAGEDSIDPDTAVQALEDIAVALQQLGAEEIIQLDKALNKVAEEYPEEAKEIIYNIMRDNGLQDELDNDSAE